MKKIASVHTQLPLLFMKEEETFLVYTPALDLCAHGDSLEDAKKSLSIEISVSH